MIHVYLFFFVTLNNFYHFLLTFNISMHVCVGNELNLAHFGIFILIVQLLRVVPMNMPMGFCL